jgi:hypothetical protein
MKRHAEENLHNSKSDMQTLWELVLYYVIGLPLLFGFAYAIALILTGLKCL